MTSTHKISFSIIDILDPNKFNSRRKSELSFAKEKFPAHSVEGTSLEWDSTAGGNLRDEHTDAGRLPPPTHQPHNTHTHTRTHDLNI